jgi:hypothetical protein
MTSNSDSKSINYTKVVDLSHVIDPSIPTWPNDPPVEFESVAELENDGYYLRRFSIGEHSGTHLNAPNSFYGDGARIDVKTDKIQMSVADAIASIPPNYHQLDLKSVLDSLPRKHSP